MRKLLYISPYLLTGMLPFLFLLLLWRYGINSPHWDDHAVRVFIDQYKDQNGFLARIEAVLSFHNEHRIGLTRLFALTSYKVEGNLNFKTLQLMGFLGLLSTWLLILLNNRRLHSPRWLYFAVSLLVINFSLHENLLWGMASIQNFWVVFLALATFYQMTFGALKQRGSLLIALLFSILATYTSGNGVMVPVIGFLLLLLQQQWKWLIYWSFTSVLCLWFYFTGYDSIPSKRWLIEPEAAQSFFSSIASLLYVDNDPSILTFNGLLLCGIIIFFLSSVVLFITLIKWLQKSTRLQNTPALHFLLSSAMFLMGTLAIVSLTRSDEGLATILSSKYKIYSYLCLALLMTYTTRLLPARLKERFSLLCSIVALGLWTLSYLGYFKYYESTKLSHKASILDHYRQVNLSNTSYKAPTNLHELKLGFAGAKQEPNLIDSISITKEKVELWENNALPKEAFAVFKSDENVFFTPMSPVPNPSILKRLYTYYSQTKKSELSLLGFPSGLYEVYYLQDKKLFDTNKTIRIEGIPYVQAPKNW